MEQGGCYPVGTVATSGYLAGPASLITGLSMFIGLVLTLDALVARFIGWLPLVVRVIASTREGMWRRWRL